MAIVKDSQVFDEEFTLSLGGDYSNYFFKLLNFASTYNKGADKIINERLEYFKEHVKNEATREVFNMNRSFTSTDDIRKLIMQKIAMVSDYFYTKNPYNAVKNFLNYDYAKLMDRSSANYEAIRNEVVRNCDYASKTSALEYIGYAPYKDAIDHVRSQAYKRSDFSMLYKPIAIEGNDVNANDLFIKVLNISRAFAIESDIISDFSIKSRQTMLNALTTLLDQPTSDNWYSNTCEAILSNYVFLSLFSDTPENLVISEKMYNTIARELSTKNVTIDDIKLAIMEGPIKFTESEIDYIDNFINNIGLLKDNYTVANTNILSLVRQPK